MYVCMYVCIKVIGVLYLFTLLTLHYITLHFFFFPTYGNVRPTYRVVSSSVYRYRVELYLCRYIESGVSVYMHGDVARF